MQTRSASRAKALKRSSWHSNFDDALDVLFVRGCLDKADYLALFQTCRNGRQFVLTTAPRATLTVSSVLLTQRLSQAHGFLTARGPLPTALVVQHEHGTELGGIPPALTGTRVTELVLQLSAPCSEDAVPAFIQQAPSAFPRLTYLSVDSPHPCSLPPPSSLPSVTRLSVKGSDILINSTAPYVSQLQTLQLAAHDPQQVIRWKRVFPLGRSPYTGLTSLTTDRTLTSEDVSVLVARAPALSRLEAGGLSLRPGAHKDTLWGVREVHVHGDRAHQCAHLPRSTAGRLDVHCTNGRLQLQARAQQGLDRTFVDSLSQFTFHTTQIRFLRSDGTEALHDAVAAAVGQLGAMQAPGATVYLPPTPWALSSVQALATAVPHAPHMTFSTLHTGGLKEEVVSALLAMSASITKVHAYNLIMATDTYAGVPWPWEEVTFVTDLRMERVTRLPNTAEATRGPPTIACDTLDFTYIPELSEVELLRYKEWLQHVYFRPRSTAQDACITINLGGWECHAFRLTDQISLLCTLKTVVTNPPVRVKVCISGVVDAHVAPALRLVPRHARGTLDMTHCHFVLESTEYASLRAHVLSRFETVLGFKE